MSLDKFNYSNVATNTTTVAKTGMGILQRIVINKPLATGVITIYDNTSAAGTKIGTITFPATLLSDGPYTIEYGVGFGTGLTVVTSAATDITIVWA